MRHIKSLVFSIALTAVFALLLTGLAFLTEHWATILDSMPFSAGYWNIALVVFMVALPVILFFTVILYFMNILIGIWE